MASNTIRFSGLASGLDTDTMVKSMLTPYKIKVDAKKQGQTLLEWKKDAYKEMSAKIYSFYTKNVANARLESSFNKKIISSSNSTAIKIETGGNPPDGAHTINKIDNLAEGARITTSVVTLDGVATKATKTTKLSELGLTITDSDTLTVYDKSVVSPGTPIALSSDMTIGQLEAAMQTAMPNTSVSYDESAGAFFINTKKTGVSQEIAITSTSADTNILNKLGLGAAGATTVGDTGVNAKLTYNDIPIESESNTVTVNGLKVTLQATTAAPITLLATTDTEAIVTYVKEFIDEYNKLIGDINTKLDADSARKYKPLTDEEKEAMTEDDIKAWEKKIKDSLFRNDATLEDLTVNMRMIMGGSIEGNAFGSFAGVGITTGYWTEKGKLNINEDELRRAISKDADAVKGLFAGQNGSDGLVDKLYTELNGKFKSISGVRSFTSVFNDVSLDKEIKDTEDEFYKLENKMYDMETRYYAKFTAMEKMMNQLNSQSTWLTQQLGGM